MAKEGSGEEPILGQGIEEKALEEIRKRVLWPKEEILAVFTGATGKRVSLRNDWLVVTDRRVAYYRRGLIGSSIDSFPYEDIDSVGRFGYAKREKFGHGKRRTLMGSIELNVSGKTSSFLGMERDEVRQAAQLIRQKIAGAKTKSSVAAIGPLNLIRKLAELRDAGAITKKEFDAKKKELLARV